MESLLLPNLLKFIIPGILLLLTLVSGFWVSQTGKPCNGFLFNIHKLIALGTVVVTIVQLIQPLKTADSLVLTITGLVVAAICVVALFASGALMSAGKLSYALMLTVHRIAPAVLVVSLALAVYELARQL